MKFKEFAVLKALAQLGGEATSDSVSEHTSLPKRAVAQIMRQNYPLVYPVSSVNDCNTWKLANPTYWSTALWRRVCRTKNGNIQGQL